MRHAWIAALTLFAMGAGLGLAASRDGAMIQNTGSTNAAGYTIKVWSDGSAWATLSDRGGAPSGQPFTATISTDLAQKFLRDAQVARKTVAVVTRCMKSASFGTSTFVHYHGWTSPDLECPGGGNAQAAVTADAHEIAGDLHLGPAAGLRRIPMPNEKRRLPEPAPTAS
jgi:hypothetical protein